MRVAFVSVSGFGQPPNRSNGAADIAEAVAQLPDVTVYLRKHNASSMKLAITLAHENHYDRIVMFAHSHGATMAVECCRTLKEFGHPVSYVIFADGWNGSGVLHVPANVIVLETWIQNLKRPAWKRKPHGSSIRLESPQTTKWIEHQAAIDISHNEIDNLPEVKAACIAAATMTANPRD